LLPIGSRNPRNYIAYCNTLYSIQCSESVLYVVWFGTIVSIESGAKPTDMD
jgi:hypothetical protein